MKQSAQYNIGKRWQSLKSYESLFLKLADAISFCGKRAEGSGSQAGWVASGSLEGIGGGLAIVIAEQWGWAASCSAKCCAVSGTLSGRPASPPPPQGWSPLCNKDKHITYMAGSIGLFMDKAGNVPYWMEKINTTKCNNTATISEILFLVYFI